MKTDNPDIERAQSSTNMINRLIGGITMRWTEAVKPLRISRDDRFATFYPAQTLASCSAARST